MLLDTHIFLWWLFGDPKLPDKIMRYIENRDHEIFISAASVWEIATKYRLGKLPQAESVAKRVPSWIEQAGFSSLSVSVEHAQLAGTWNIAHRDPFDRMLAAQAKLENIPLATVDKVLHQFPIEIMDGGVD
jgi:PIN domain nuclease of toxin-antitoxin system